MTTKLMTVNEVSELLGIKQARAYQMTREGLIPYVLLGQRQYRYSRQAIEDFINRGGNVDSQHEEVTNYE